MEGVSLPGCAFLEGVMNRIKELREEKSLLQKDIAGILGISQRKYSYIETGTTALKYDVLIKLSNYYKVSIDYILCRTDKRK